MKLNLWLVISMGLSTSVLAQVTNLPPAGAIQDVTNRAPTAAVATNVPATNAVPAAAAVVAPAEKPAPAAAPKKAATKKSAKAKSTQKFAAFTTALTPGTAKAIGNNVNVRGQARLSSEVITKITKDQEVQVLSEIVRDNSAADEPSAWAKIVLPAGTPVWVHSGFVSNNTVVPARLNMRSGPGENYSAVGLLTHGASVSPVATNGVWLKIEQPGDAFGFVASQYLRQDKGIEVASSGSTGAKASTGAASTTGSTDMAAEDDTTTAVAGTTTIPETPVTTTKVNEDAAVAAAPGEPVLSPSAVIEPVKPAPAGTNNATQVASAAIGSGEATTSAITNEPAADLPPPKRIVSREGIVRGTTSIQAPTHFALVSPVNFKLINYLYSPSPTLDLRRYKGLHIVVTGEEALEERWGNTPVITIQELELLDE